MTKESKLAVLEEELDTLDAMMVALVDLLEERKVLTHEEWDKKVESVLHSQRKLRSFRAPREK